MTITSNIDDTAIYSTGSIQCPTDTYTISSNAYNWGEVLIAPTTTAAAIQANGTLSLNGEKADITINGQSLTSVLEKLSERINILTVNQELESEWEELRQLGEQYRKLEKEILTKMETWNRLKSSDSDNR